MKVSIFDFGEICFKIMKKYHLKMKKNILRTFDILFDLARPDDHKMFILVHKISLEVAIS